MLQVEKRTNIEAAHAVLDLLLTKAAVSGKAMTTHIDIPASELNNMGDLTVQIVLKWSKSGNKKAETGN